MASLEDSDKVKAMTPFHKKVLTKAHPLVMENMTVTEALRSHLSADGVLDLDELRITREKTGNNAQNTYLLELLHRRPDCAYDSFVKALEATGQDHVADIIKKKEAELKQEGAHRMSQIANHRYVLFSSEASFGQEPHQTAVMRCEAEAYIGSLNISNAVALPGKPDQQQGEVWNHDCRPKHPPMSPELPMILDDRSSFNENKDVALPKQLTEKQRRFQERQKQRKSGRINGAQQSPLPSEGCMIGVKLFIREVCSIGDDWSVPEEALQKDIENYIWTTLSQVLTKTLPEKLSPELDSQGKIMILEFLLSLRDYCKVKHVGFEPVQLVVQCMTAESLDKLSEVDSKGTLADQLGDAMRTETLTRTLKIKDILLETAISEPEVKLAGRILKERVATVDLKMQSTPESNSLVEHAWLKQVQTDLLENGTAIHTAVEAFSTKVREIQKSSILFTLQFYSKDDLHAFRENLDSGQLANLFEKALITDDVKQEYGVDTLGLSLTMVDPWEYDMCEMELDSTTFEDDEHSSEDESVEGKHLEPSCYCYEHAQTVKQLQMTNNQLQMTNNQLTEKCDALQQVVTQQEKTIERQLGYCSEYAQTNENLKTENEKLRESQLEWKQIKKEERPPSFPVPGNESSPDSGIHDQGVPKAKVYVLDCIGAASDSHEFHLNIEEPEVEEKQLDLRGYQMELAQPALDGKNIIVSAPTGTGKTHVALKIVQEHFRKADPEQEPKVVFLVPAVELVRQQWKMFKTYLHNHKSVGLSGDLNLLEKVPVERLIHRYEIIILTPHILVDALKDQSVSSLSVFSLLLYDECHHTMKGHPYARVQDYYLTTKMQNPDQPTSLPQVVGFTASVGVGRKTRTLDGAVNHILKLCANLDVEILKTVEKNRWELAKYENKPYEERKEVKGRLRDSFHDEVSQMMNIIETKMKRAPELGNVSDQQTAQQLAAPPGERGGERYAEWLGKLEKPIAHIHDQDARRFFHACTNHLEFYNCSLVVNADCRTVDALKVIETKMKKLTPEQEDETVKWLSGMFRDHKDSLKQAGDDPRNSNPKLEVVKRMLYEGYQKNPDNLRCIMFVKTREMTEALANWINDDGELKHLAASSLAGKGRSTEKAGMNQAQQKDVLQYFKDGMHKVIVATTVAEEGLDIQKCNLVIRYEHVTNEIAYVQARGLGRTEHAEYYLEEINVMREQLMEKAIKRIREMEEQTFQRYINLYQQEILREWRRTETRRNRRVRSASDDEEDVYELRCIRCNQLACFSSDICKVKDSHHIVTDVKILEEVNIEPDPRPGTYDAFTKLGKLFCKECGEDWGIQVLYKGIKLPVIKISAFVVVFPNGTRESFKKWSQSPFDNDLQNLTDEEMKEYNNELKELDLQ